MGHTTAVRIDLRPGGRFTYRMEAKGGSMGFDFQGAFTQVTELRRIGYTLDDKRRVRVNFGVDEWGVTVRERFDTEPSQDPEMQRLGWQAILDHLAAHVQALK